MVKSLPAMQETWVQSLAREDPLEKEMATHSSTVAWKIPWIEKPGGLQSMRSQRVVLYDFTFTPALHIVYHLSHHGRIAEGRKTEGRRKDRRKRQIEGEEKIMMTM